jgi:hypothetical protein
MGASFFRLLTQKHPEIFSGIGDLNTSYDYSPLLGHGLLLRSTDGLPAVKVSLHCDDFCVHGPTQEKTAGALSLMDRALDVGLLFNPKQVNPPSQEANIAVSFTTPGQYRRLLFLWTNGAALLQ